MKTDHTTFDHGIVGYLEYDQDCASPLDDNEAVKFAVLHRCYSNPAPECGGDPDELAQWAKDNADEWDAFPLFMLDHGDTDYSISDFSDPWDSGRVGFVFVKKSEVSDTRRTAISMCEEYTRWANGDCWGYIIEDEDGEHLDSCWGFIGEEYATEEMREAAEGFVDDAGKRKACELATAIQASRPDLGGDA